MPSTERALVVDADHEGGADVTPAWPAGDSLTEADMSGSHDDGSMPAAQPNRTPRSPLRDDLIRRPRIERVTLTPSARASGTPERPETLPGPLAKAYRPMEESPRGAGPQTL